MARGKDVGIFLVGTLLQQIVTFATGILVARWLGPSNYGVLSVTRNILTVVMIIAPLGLDLSLLRHLSEISENASKSFSHVKMLRLMVACVTGFLVLLVALLVGPLLEAHVYHQLGFSKYLSLTFITLPFMADIAIMTAVFRAYHNPAPQLFVSLFVQPLIRLAGIVFFLILGLGLVGVLSATAIGAIISCTLISILFARFIRSKKAHPHRFDEGDLAAIKKLMKYSIWLAMTLIVYGGLKSLDVLMLGIYRKPDEVGNYAALCAIAQLIGIASASLSQTLGPTVAKYYSAGDIKGMAKELNQYLRNASLMSAPIFAGVAVFGTWMDIVFGPKYHFTFTVSACIASGYYISAVLGPMGFSLSMTGKHRIEFSILACGSAVVLILCWLLIPRFGGIGAALSVVIGFFTINAIRYLAVRKIHKISIGNLRDFLPPILCFCIAWLSSTIAFITGKSLVSMVAMIAIYLLVTGGLMWILLFDHKQRLYFLKKLADLKPSWVVS